MAKILLGVTGSVAAIRTPSLFAALREAGHDVRVIATEPSLYFFDPKEMGEDSVYRDSHEWPSDRWRRDDPVLHIAFRDWADLLIVAPLDANTLGKFALGLCDNFLTCVFRAWDFRRTVILAPAMNTLMWQNPPTKRQLSLLLDDHGTGAPNEWKLEDADTIFASHAPRIILIPPQSKRLACGDVGIGAMAEVVTIAEMVRIL